jgi:large subunit ribosomal protein L15
MQLNQLQNNWGARKARKRIGRGIGSGTGKTSGKGHKGQWARSGVSFRGFEGGQMPLQRRLPKRGFNQPNRVEYVIINLADIQRAVDAKRLDSKVEISMETLLQAKLLKKNRPLRVLGKGNITVAVTIVAEYVTAAAQKAIEQAGGSVKVIASKTSE